LFQCRKFLFQVWYLWGHSNTEHLPCSKISMICIYWRFEILEIKLCRKFCCFRYILWNYEECIYKVKIHLPITSAWMSVWSNRRTFTSGRQRSVVRIQLRVTFFKLYFLLEILGPMFKFINIKHLLTNFNTCQNLWKVPFKGIFSRFGKLTKLKKVVSDSQIFVLVMIFVRKQYYWTFTIVQYSHYMYLLTIWKPKNYKALQRETIE